MMGLIKANGTSKDDSHMPLSNIYRGAYFFLAQRSPALFASTKRCLVPRGLPKRVFYTHPAVVSHCTPPSLDLVQIHWLILEYGKQSLYANFH